MANPLFNEQMNKGFASQFNLFKQNPLQFLLQRRINIPPQFANDPQAAVQYLLNSGKMSQSQLETLTGYAQQMGLKLN